MRLRWIAFVAALCAPLGAGSALAQGTRPANPERSVVILPMIADEEDVMAVQAAAYVWPQIAYQVAQDPTVRVIEPLTMPPEFHDEASAVDAAQQFGARYVFMAKVSGENIYRFDSALRDGRTGAILWGHVFFTDEYNIHSLAGEMGVALRFVFEKLP